MAKNITKTITYKSLVTALAEDASGDEIDMLDTSLDGTFALATGILLRGGYNTSNVKGNQPTTLNGNLTVHAGDSNAESVVVKGKLSVKGGSLRVNGVTVKAVEVK